MAIKPGHDGSIAVVEDGHLLWCLESEKDGFDRFVSLTPTTVLKISERLDRIPDIIALGGWSRARWAGSVGAGYSGADAFQSYPSKFFGKDVKYFTSSHERSHIMMAVGMAPSTNADLISVLVWEGVTGSFYLLDREWNIKRKIPVLDNPGGRYAFLYALADPTFPDHGSRPRLDVSGKLMALAAFGDADNTDPKVDKLVDRIMKIDKWHASLKAEFSETIGHNVGVESMITKAAAAVLSKRIFDEFAQVALRELPPGTPLRISGGCGLNCDWNSAWRNLGHFSSVFVPPCTNDSGSSIGTAIDALSHFGYRKPLDWSVYSGLEFDHDTNPDPERWNRQRFDEAALSRSIAHGSVVAFVQGRWEIGPRALGHRSLLAEPFNASTKERLNDLKKRESYRPIAPCCREEDLSKAFVEDFDDPYMLYFRHVKSPKLEAVTHVDGSARAQSVSSVSNPRLHQLLGAFADETGLGVLCNTSLNFNGLGFINRMSDLVQYCEDRRIEHMVIDDQWYSLRA